MVLGLLLQTLPPSDILPGLAGQTACVVPPTVDHPSIDAPKDGLVMATVLV